MPVLNDSLEVLVAGVRLSRVLAAVRCELSVSAGRAEIQAVINAHAAGEMSSEAMLLATIATLLIRLRGKEPLPGIVD